MAEGCPSLLTDPNFVAEQTGKLRPEAVQWEMGQAPFGWPETPGLRGQARLTGVEARRQLQRPGRAQAGVQSRLGAGARVAANCPSTAKRSLSPTPHPPPGPCPGLVACSLPPVPPQPSSRPGVPRESGRRWPAPGREIQGKIMARGRRGGTGAGTPDAGSVHNRGPAARLALPSARHTQPVYKTLGGPH